MRCTYPAIFEKNELGGYSIHFPDLPECYTDGDSLEDAIEMASEAMELVVESYVDNGRPLPLPSLDCNPPEGKRLVYITSICAASGTA